MIYRIDSLDIDTVRGCVLRDGQEVPLNAKAFRVLVHFLQERNRLVTKEELLELFWTGTAVSDDAITQCIARLRRVLGDDRRESVYLKTVPRRGYRFVGSVQEIDPDAVQESSAADDVIALPEPLETKTWTAQRMRWMVAGMLGAGLAIAIAFWSSGLRHLPFVTVHANRAVSREPERWEVAWWKLNEGSGANITDSVHGLTATLPAGVSWTQGISGSALLFSGRELVVRGDDPQVLPKGEEPRTFTAWVKTGTTSGDLTPILFPGDPTPDSGSGFGLGLNEEGMAAIGSGLRPLLGKRRIDDDRWHQVAGVFEGGQSKWVRLFVDGREQSSTQGLVQLRQTRESFWSIGTAFRPGTNFRGAIDDVRVFERALRSDEIWSLHRCISGADDIDIEGRGSYYFAPIFGDHVEILPRRSGERSAGVRNTANDVAGVILVKGEPDCGLRSIHGADIGQDLNIEAELLVPPGPGGAVTDGGPYFRSRRANPGDGIMGGTSGGYWVRLDSTGQVRVQRLHPSLIMGFSSPPARFDPSVFHKLEAAVHGQTLEVALDGRPVTFDVSGVQQKVLEIPPAWETASPKGNNDGSAGIAFSCRTNRGQAGGQEARDIRVTPYHSLAPLPVTTIQSR